MKMFLRITFMAFALFVSCDCFGMERAPQLQVVKTRKKCCCGLGLLCNLVFAIVKSPFSSGGNGSGSNAQTETELAKDPFKSGCWNEYMIPNNVLDCDSVEDDSKPMPLEEAFLAWKQEVLVSPKPTGEVPKEYTQILEKEIDDLRRTAEALEFFSGAGAESFLESIGYSDGAKELAQSMDNLLPVLLKISGREGIAVEILKSLKPVCLMLWPPRGSVVVPELPESIRKEFGE